MFGSTARKVVDIDPARALFDAIGRFLAEHRLGYEPAHYGFAYRVLSEPGSSLAKAVQALTEGGVRLTERDIATLGGSAPAPRTSAALDRAAALIAQTRSQMEDFTGLVDRMRAETNEFGRDLAASVDALDPQVAPGIVDLTAAMLARVEDAETSLQSATSEAAGLRAELAEARIDAREDPLTGLANRRALTEAYEERLAAARPLCLAVCDVDHFKQVNDRFGHTVGDRVLTAIATTLAEACQGALVARYGGEEFAVLFDHGDLSAAEAALERARATVATKRYRLRDAETVLGTITFSGGVVLGAQGEAFDTVFARADTLLYAAKDAGRNRIHV